MHIEREYISMETVAYKIPILELKKAQLFLNNQPLKVNIIELMNPELASVLTQITAYTGSLYSNCTDHYLKVYRNAQRKIVEDTLKKNGIPPYLVLHGVDPEDPTHDYVDLSIYITGSKIRVPRMVASSKYRIDSNKMEAYLTELTEEEMHSVLHINSSLYDIYNRDASSPNNIIPFFPKENKRKEKSRR